MASVQISKEEMLKRVALFKELQPSRQAFVDSLIPEHERAIFNVIGRGVTEDASLRPAITDARDFNFTLVQAESGKGAALHSHPRWRCLFPCPASCLSTGGITERTRSFLGPGILFLFRQGLCGGSVTLAARVAISWPFSVGPMLDG